jgi:hypothetical protein
MPPQTEPKGDHIVVTLGGAVPAPPLDGPAALTLDQWLASLPDSVLKFLAAPAHHGTGAPLPTAQRVRALLEFVADGRMCEIRPNLSPWAVALASYLDAHLKRTETGIVASQTLFDACHAHLAGMVGHPTERQLRRQLVRWIAAVHGIRQSRDVSNPSRRAWRGITFTPAPPSA